MMQSLKKVERLDWRMTCFTCIKAIVTNSVSVLPYAHPQLFKVFKHLIYVCHECGMQFERFYSLNNSVLGSFSHLHSMISANSPKSGDTSVVVTV